ncbi:hypothetical protein QG516_03825 [Pedobacter gandavensis]|uniref:hypothetical protein n=1 Tax=Pedobacter gandavensis TaxID=2679963 RepID=UPI002479DF9E|nr:hypothetical protein [Pedobacter gandavensis]WGQ10782.1 hypothetical protein QG516_03825 [Pedobacter gandavensis]
MKVQTTNNMKFGAQKGNKRKSAGNIKNRSDRLPKPKSKKKRKAGPGLYMMIFFWVLIILLGVAVFLKFRHYITAHW